MTCDCSCIPTPDSILEDDEIDVFEEIFPDSEAYHDVMREALWANYGLRGIGNCDIAYWIKAMKCRYRQIRTYYEIKFAAFEDWITNVDLSDLSDSSSEYQTVSANEDNPDNPQGTTVYLSDRNTVTYNGKSYSGLSTETIARFIDNVKNIEKEFADEFRMQFYHGI